MADSLIQQVGARRQRRSTAEKREIVEQTMQPGASVTRVAQRYGLKAKRVYYWRNLYRQGRLGKASTGSNLSLLPVRVAEATGRKIVDPLAKRNLATTMGRIYIDLPQAHLSIEGRADASALRMVLEYLVR